jgi:pyruvate,water dikinase
VSVGKVTGKVKILFTPKDVNLMNKGDVLVAPMTSPDYILAMRKAIAIVTDVGGLMSHAAIVSRELKIPCIVGTKIATKVLKDGDLVEVDANNGVVRIIK